MQDDAFAGKMRERQNGWEKEEKRMIISASRRTDIPAYFSEWFFNRLREGYVLVRNPMHTKQISYVNLSPEVVDGIVFWTKNPLPMFERLSELEPYTYYFQFTLNPYGKRIEPGLPSKEEALLPAFVRLSEKIGRDRIVWRYDPILFNDTYTVDYHCGAFRHFAKQISDYTEKCTVSFLDAYQHTARNRKALRIQEDTPEMQQEVMERFSRTAKEYGLSLDTCAEPLDFQAFGVSRASCIDQERLERIGGFRLSAKKDTGQRAECRCIASIDIGAYQTCENGCLYCYANHNQEQVLENAQKHNAQSPLLVGEPGPEDVIKERKMASWKDNQLSLFDFIV